MTKTQKTVKTIRQSLLESGLVTEADLGHQASDLHVRHLPGVEQHIREHFPVARLNVFALQPGCDWHQRGDRLAIEVHFGFMDEWAELRQGR